MESNYALYVREREGRDIVEDEKGFATFTIQDESCYIVDIFVRKEFRQQGLASKYADKIAEIAKEKGCKFLVGSVCWTTNGASASEKVLRAYGFEPSYEHGPMTFYKKHI